MKKTLLLMAIIVTQLTAVFASDEKVNPTVENNFKSRFPGATEVEWQSGPNYYKASFTYNNVKLFAIYSDDASLMGIARNITSSQLPYFLQAGLKKRLANYWITDLYEMSGERGFGHYMTLQNADNVVILESTEGDDWKIISIN